MVQGAILSAAAEAEKKRYLGQWPCTQHSAMHAGESKSSLSISSWESCWKVTSPRLNIHIHLLKSIQFVNRLSSSPCFPVG